jgi:predicted nucleotidyltransferase component of viral defense system
MQHVTAKDYIDLSKLTSVAINDFSLVLKKFIDSARETSSDDNVSTTRDKLSSIMSRLKGKSVQVLFMLGLFFVNSSQLVEM